MFSSNRGLSRKLGKKSFWLELSENGEDTVGEGFGSFKCSKITDTSGRLRYEKSVGLGLENEKVLGARRSLLKSLCSELEALDADWLGSGWFEG